MPTLLEAPFTAQGFPAGIPTGGTLTFRSDDLAHALFTTGRAPGDQARHGSASLWEFIHRASLIPAYLRRTSTRAIHKSALAQDLDRSEKVGLSYALGQAMTAIYCREQLGVDFLMHVDRYATRHGVTFGLGRKRPDLFGMTLPGDWIVAEAKGRSNGMERGLPAQLAGQKSMIKSINGTKPTVALGCVSSFPVLYSGVWDRLRVDVVDPPQEPEAADIVVDLDRFWRAYYEPFVLAAGAGEAVDDLPGYVVSRFPGLGLQVGLRTSIHELLAGDEPITADLLGSASASIADGGEDPIGFSDGTLIETLWADALAILDYEA